MGQAIVFVRNLSFLGFVCGAALLLSPMVRELPKPAALITQLSGPEPEASETPAPETKTAPPDLPPITERPSHQEAHAPVLQPGKEADTDTLASTSEFGSGEGSALTLEKQLFSAHAEPTVAPGSDGIVNAEVPFRDGPDVTSTVMGLVPAGTRVHVEANADLGFLLVTFSLDGADRRDYVIGSAVTAEDVPPP